MYVYIRDKNKGEVAWTNITDFVVSDIVIDDVIDGTQDTANFTLLLNSDFTYLDYDKPIKPKLQVKISQVTSEALENEVNTYWFLTGDCEAKQLRKGNDSVKELYKHVVNLREYSEIASDTNLPNYTITQNKAQYSDMYSRYGFRDVVLNYKFQQDGTSKLMPFSSNYTDNYLPTNDGNISFGYDTGTSRYYTEIKELDVVGYNINFSINHRRTSNALAIAGLLNNITYDIYTSRGSTSRASSLTRINANIKYYNGSTLISEENIENSINYVGGFVDVSRNVLGGINKILSLPASYTSSEFNLQINKRSTANRAVIYFSILHNSLDAETNVVQGTGIYTVPIETEISGFSNNSYTKVDIQSMRISVISGQLQDEIVVPKTTLLQFVEKGLFDYNLNRRDKLTLSPETSVLLDVEAKEGEWLEYDFRELLERAFKYIGCIYYITINNVITHIKPEVKSITVPLKDTQSLDENISYENHFDTIVSKAKNIMSQNDFVTERILVGSIQNDFSQFTEETAGFITSNNVYFISSVKLHTPSFSFVLNGQTFTSNIEVPYTWDITSRVLEKDIYNALPDVRYDTARVVANQWPSQRATGDLGQGNTIYYESGSNIVGGICHMSPTIPAYNIETGTVIALPAQYAIIEMLVCLAYETISIPAYQIPDPTIDFEFPTIQNFELEITYCPIFEEITTKYISNMKNRQGLNWEKKVNVSDRIISYEDNEEVLKNDMESKGNNEISYEVSVKTLEDTLRTGDIINGNMYVTSKRMVINKEMINVTYRLQENFIIENQDVGLSIKFERYAIPYEYVNREMILENHMVFSKTKKENYLTDRYYITTLLEDVYETNNIQGALYANLRVFYEDSSNRDILMRLAKIDSKFTMILSGKFLDNYGAGIQRFAGTINSNAAIFSQPYRYCDYQGKALGVSLRNVGYNNGANSNSSRLVASNGTITAPYPLNRFPEFSFDNYITQFTRNYYLGLESILLMNYKDAREALSLNIHNFLETEDENIKFYGFKQINKTAILNSDLELTDDLDIDDVTPYLTNILSRNVDIMQDGGHDLMRLTLAQSTYNGKNIALLNETNGKYTLVGIVKNISVNSSNQFDIYVYGLKYGRTA